MFHCVLESKSFLEKMIVLEHTTPFFLPIHDAENEFLSSNAMVSFAALVSYLICYYAYSKCFIVLLGLQKFIDYVGDLLQAYVDRREQVQYYNNILEGINYFLIC